MNQEDTDHGDDLRYQQHPLQEDMVSRDTLHCQFLPVSDLTEEMLGLTARYTLFPRTRGKKAPSSDRDQVIVRVLGIGTDALVPPGLYMSRVRTGVGQSLFKSAIFLDRTNQNFYRIGAINTMQLLKPNVTHT